MLLDRYKKAGIPTGDALGLPYPLYFTHPAREYNALTRYAGVIDLTHWSVFRVSGADRSSFLNAMVTNDVGSLPVGEGRHSLLTTIKGKIAAELYMVARQDDVLVIAPQGGAAAREVLEKHIITEDVTIDDASTAWGMIAVEGPKAEDIMWRLFEKGPFPKEPLQLVERQFENLTVLAVRGTVSGESGYHLLIPADEIDRLYQYIVQGALGSDGVPVGSLAWNIRRTENGLPWHGADFGGDNFPQEARLESAVSYEKGCFLGQETLARLHHQGHVNRMLVGMALEPDSVPEALRGLAFDDADALHALDEAQQREQAAPIAAALDLSGTFPPGSPLYPAERPGDEKAVGSITTAVYSPRLGTVLFLGYVRREHADAGTALSLDGPGGPYPLKTTALPVP